MRRRAERITEDGVREVRCPKCGVWKPRTAEFFGNSKRESDGLTSWCRTCSRDATRARRARQRKPEGTPVVASGPEVHTCPRCGESYPRGAEFFYRYRRKFPDGYRERWDSWCKECRKGVAREYRERDLEASRKRSRRYLARVKADPVLLERQRESRRLSYRKKREERGLPLLEPSRRPASVAREDGGLIPAEPLAAHLEGILVRWRVWDPVSRRVAYDDRRLPADPCKAPVMLFDEAANRWGLGERRLRSLLVREREWIQHDVADRLCTYGLEDPGLFRELYPDLFEFGPRRRFEAASWVLEQLDQADQGRVAELASEYGRTVGQFRHWLKCRKRLDPDEAARILDRVGV